MADYFPPAGFYFKVLFTPSGGSTLGETSFKEVSGLTVDTSPEEVTEGGLLQYKHKLPTTFKYANLVLKRGLLISSQLRTWVENAVHKFEFEPMLVTVELLNQFEQKETTPKALMTWTFHNAWPVKYEIAQMDASSNEVLIETLELAYDYFETKPGT